ncbi:MAG: hypothetical protein K8I30_18575 [Anaerolineae bacterium]|nr:hypothetical protein [Anaerolineae bacterium]
MFFSIEQPSVDSDYNPLVRHWSPESEKYGSGDALLSAMDAGWMITGLIMRQEIWYTGRRRVAVYHFDLQRGDDSVRMAVVDNPRVARLVQECGVRVVQMNHRVPRDGEQW